ncbi:MAG: Holliday junction resolvase RecU [Eubacteriales bacterium]|nr:Holliday junction resolvase RecU [Eubacteriales bacterium]
MATWNSRGLRGSTFEDLINRTNEQYMEKNLALVQKIPTPITPVKMDKEHRQITLAYFEQRSTVDYIGAVQGIPVCFDAKECNADTFPLANIHPHQIEFMQRFERQNGVAFILIFYTKYNEYYYLTLRELMKFWKRMQEGGRKSFRKDELTAKYYLPQKGSFFVPYLDGISIDLAERD